MGWRDRLGGRSRGQAERGVLAFEQDLDIATADELAARAAAAEEDLVIDLSRCAFADSTGVRTLLAVARTRTAAGLRTVFVVAPGSAVEDVLRLTGAATVLSTAVSVGDARGLLSGASRPG